MDREFIIFGIIAVILVCVGVIGYVVTTSQIIRDQEDEIAKLKAERVKQDNVSPLQSVKDKYPQFGEF